MRKSILFVLFILITTIKSHAILVSVGDFQGFRVHFTPSHGGEEAFFPKFSSSGRMIYNYELSLFAEDHLSGFWHTDNNINMMMGMNLRAVQFKNVDRYGMSLLRQCQKKIEIAVIYNKRIRLEIKFKEDVSNTLTEDGHTIKVANTSARDFEYIKCAVL